MSEKKFRNLQRARDLLNDVTDENRIVTLNTIFSITPSIFESPQHQQQLKQTFPPNDIKYMNLAALNTMRLYRRSNAKKVAICCMPKSGSTFILTSLRALPEMDFIVGYFHVPYDNPSFVDAVECENEIDEMAILRLEMRQRNTLVHTHTKCAPYTEKMIAAHNYRPVVVQRNIFDCIVSMDDMICRNQVPGFGMFRPPAGYSDLPRDKRLAFLCRYVGPWYIDFVVSWARTRLKPLYLSYEDDVRGFDETSAQKIRSGLGLENVSEEDFLTAFSLNSDKKKESARLNVGVSGRGADIPADARDALRQLADVYAGDADFTGLL